MKVSSSRKIEIAGHAYIGGAEKPVTMLVGDGKILSIAGGISPTADPDTTHIALDDCDVIFPGLVNLHTHTDYNVLPIWGSGVKWSSRHQWRHNTDYMKWVADFDKYIKDGWAANPLTVRHLMQIQKKAAKSPADIQAFVATHMTEIQRVLAVVTEMQAVAGGTTTIQETYNLDGEDPTKRLFIIRNTGDVGDLGVTPPQLINSVVDLYQPDPQPTGAANEDTSTWRVKAYGTKVQELQKGMTNAGEPFYSTIAHIAEGRTGYLIQGCDPYSRNEFKQLMNDLGSVSNLKNANLLLVHANGCNWDNDDTISFLSENNIGVVWSPFSNLLLYGDTLPIGKLLEAGLRVCLGSDWAPSGSKHLFDEMKLAKCFLDSRGISIPEKKLFDMVSSVPAKCLGGLQIGEVAAGNYADLFVFRKKDPGVSAVESMLTQDDDSIQFTMVNGRIAYGQNGLFQNILQVDAEPIPSSEGPSTAGRSLSLNSNLGIQLATSLPKLDSIFSTYARNVLKDPSVQRPKMLSTDDAVYKERVRQMENSF
jgi:hypothetical protein